MAVSDRLVPTYAQPYDLGAELCKVLGLDPSLVRSFSIESDAQAGTLYVKATLYVRNEHGREIATKLARWALTSREEGMADPLMGEAVSHDARANTLALEPLEGLGG